MFIWCAAGLTSAQGSAENNFISVWSIWAPPCLILYKHFQTSPGKFLATLWPPGARYYIADFRVVLGNNVLFGTRNIFEGVKTLVEQRESGTLTPQLYKLLKQSSHVQNGRMRKAQGHCFKFLEFEGLPNEVCCLFFFLWFRQSCLLAFFQYCQMRETSMMLLK